MIYIQTKKILYIIQGVDAILDPTFCRNYDAAISLIKILRKTVQFGFFLRNKEKSVSMFVKKMSPNIVLCTIYNCRALVH